MRNKKHVEYDYGYDNEPESVHHFIGEVERSFDLEPQSYDNSGEFVQDVYEIAADVILNEIEKKTG